jgi:Ca-activated chloride channel family protein
VAGAEGVVASRSRRPLRSAAAALLVLALARPAAAAPAPPPAAVEIVLDASESMEARLPSGEQKIADLRAAAASVARRLPDATPLALRAFGHRSPRERRDCEDTALLVPLGPVADARDRIAREAAMLSARGVTPLARVLALAAKDLPRPAGGGVRAIVLVSDGAETCGGDPCAAARELRAADPDLVIHTVGVAPDAVARGLLECVAAVAGGRYFHVEDSARLGDTVAKAARAPGVAPADWRGAGTLKVAGAGIDGHRVLEAAGGKVVATVSRAADTVKLPAGVYDVAFGTSFWRTVTVEAGKTTVLAPGTLRVRRASVPGHAVLAAETGETVATLSSAAASATLLPGFYDVRFEGALWPLVRVDPGRETLLDPGVVEVRHATAEGQRVFSRDGRTVGSVSAAGNSLALPPGEYQVEIGSTRHHFTLSAGQRVVFETK